MEVRKCSICGKEMTVDKFKTWTRKDGSLGVSSYCVKCMNKKSNERYRSIRIAGALSVYSDKELIDEMKRRGLLNH